MINLGIFGFGRIGAEHAGWLSRSDSIRAAAVVDATPARQILAQQRGLRVYDRAESLLKDTAIDAVLIATPTAMHFDIAKLALEAGKHVMVEKPMAMNLAQSRELASLARDKGRVLSVFHNRRWDIDYLTVGSLIKSARLGKLINVESRLGQFASCVGPAAKEYRPNWRNEGSFGGGALYDWGSHFVDQIWRLFWPIRPLRVFAQLRGNVWSKDCDDFARVVIDFEQGICALVEINTTTTDSLPRWHIDGTLGSASSPQSPMFDTHAWANLRLTPATADAGDTAGSRLFPKCAPGLTETDIWDRFAGAIVGTSAPAVSAESVLPTMALLDAARESSRSGRVVEIDSSDWTY